MTQIKQVVATAFAVVTLAAGQPGWAGDKPGENKQTFTGLVIELQGQKFQPALSVRVLSEDGQVVYGEMKQLTSAATERLIERGMAAFATNWQDVEQRCGQNPLVIKSVAVNGEDIVISSADAEQVLQADAGKHFLAGLQVAVYTAPLPPPSVEAEPETQQETSEVITEKDLPADEQ